MRNWNERSKHWLAAIISIIAFVPNVWSHNLDTSYTRIKISPREFEAAFAFDITTLLKIVELDENNDREVTKAELLRKAPAIYEFLRNKIALKFDSEVVDFGEVAPPEFSKRISSVPEKDYHQVLVRFVFRKRSMNYRALSLSITPSLTS